MIIFGNECDNVVTMCREFTNGDTITFQDVEIVVNDNIPVYHKMAITDIQKGEQIIKYGQPIGIASKDILKGNHVHVHNLESSRGRGDKGDHI